jgi:hypothetical protein
LAQGWGAVPDAIGSRTLPLGTHPATVQFSQAVYEAKANAIILSIQADLCFYLVRHRKQGYLFHPANFFQWKEEDKLWLKSEFDPEPDLNAASSMANLAAIIEKIRARSDTPILVYNLSHVIPGETVHNHQCFGEGYATRIRRFNLGLIELSRKTGISSSMSTHYWPDTAPKR